ncbi:MAG: FtsX-like permease family protein [Syntrophobacteraceae bacterium]
MRGFFRLWVWFSFRELKGHAWRTVVVLAGISLGAAVFTSVRLATNASVQSFANGMDAISGRAERTVTLPGGRLPEELVSVLFNSPDLTAVSPLMSAYVRVEGSDEPLLLLGVDPILDRPLRTWTSEPPDSREASSLWRRLIGEPFTMIAAKRFLQKSGVRTGESVRLQGVAGAGSFLVLGELASEEPATLEGGNIAIVDIATFQEFTGVYGEVERIDLIFTRPLTADKLDRVKALLPAGAELAQPSEAKETGRAMIRAYQMNLSVLSFVSLFVGMFLVYSMISLHATSRRKELAILRSIGASSRLLFLLFIAEGCFFGIVGWALAVPASLFMTEKLIGYVSSTVSHLFARVNVEGFGLTGREMLLSFAITLLVAVLAACQPAFEASRVRAREALLMREASSQEEGNLIRRLAIVGSFLAAAVLPLARMPGFSGIPVSGYMATFSLFLGFALFSPLILKAAGTHLPAIVIRAGLGETACLGTSYLKSAGARVAISVGALITAIGLFSALVIMIHSFRDSVSAWIHQSLNGDLYVRAKMSEINGYRDSLPPEIAAGLDKLRSEADVVPYRRILLKYDGIPYMLEPIDTESYLRRSGFTFIEGAPAAVASALNEGKGVLVSEVFSNQTGLRVGDRFKAVVESVEFDMPILGIIRDYRTRGGVVHCSLPFFERATADRQWTGAIIFVNDRGAGPGRRITSLRNRILLSAAQRGESIEAIAGSDLRLNILKIFDETFAVTTALLFISLVISALGVATTLTILVLERIRQFQTMIATGASAAQIRAVIGWEALTMVLMGEALGLGCGFVLSVLLIFVINKQSFGWTFIYSVDWLTLAVSFPLVCAAALLAAVPAAQPVFRGTPASVLR